MKKALVITYNYPPVGGGRVIRALKFVKYLRNFHWEPVILTVKKPLVPEYDYTLFKEIPPDIKIYRTFSINFSGIISLGKSLRSGRIKPDAFSRIKRLFYKFVEGIRPWIFLPDSRIGWIPFAVFKGLKVIKREKISVIFVIGEPFSSFLSGMVLKILTQKPLVLDFRDEWSEFNPYFNSQGKGKFIKRIEEKLESIVVKRADRVISTTPAFIENFRRRYARLDKEKFIHISNGFDSSDFAGIEQKRKKDEFIITYAGALRQFRSPQYFFEAIEQLTEEEADLAKCTKLYFLGTIEPELSPLFNRQKIITFISKIGFLDFRSTLSYLKNSSVLLYIEDQIDIADRIVGGKLFEYIGAERPILALANGGTVRDIVESTRSGLVVAPNDVDGIKMAVKLLYDKYHKNNLPLKLEKEQVVKFHRKSLTQKLADVFDSITTTS